MLEKLLGRLGLKSTEPSAPVVVPDISRVVRLRQPAPSPSVFGVERESVTHSFVDPDALGDMAEQAVDDLSIQFETWMSADLQQLYAAWENAKDSSAAPEQMRELFTAAHNIRGVASSYGYPAISRLCGSLSNLLTNGEGDRDFALINLHVEACKAAHRSPASSDVSDAVCDALEKRVEKRPVARL